MEFYFKNYDYYRIFINLIFNNFLLPKLELFMNIVLVSCLFVFFVDAKIWKFHENRK